MTTDSTATAMTTTGDESALRKAIEAAINSASAENASDTPDFILAEYLIGCLDAFDRAVRQREKWYGRREFV